MRPAKIAFSHSSFFASTTYAPLCSLGESRPRCFLLLAGVFFLGCGANGPASSSDRGAPSSVARGPVSAKENVLFPAGAAASTNGASAVLPAGAASDDPMMICPMLLQEARTAGGNANVYQAPTDAERSALGRAIEAAWKGHEDEARAAAAPAGFEVQRVTEAPGTLLLREIPPRYRGGGAYLLRLSSSSRLVVQAPHTFFDEGTAPLACEMFARTQAGALFVNTVHRYLKRPPPAASVAANENDGSLADVAHLRGSFFQTATEAATRSVPSLFVVQLHGFSDRVDGTNVVLSAGTKRLSNDRTSVVAHAIEQLAGGKVRRFPEDIADLGATTNVQGHVVRRAGGFFLHVEMSQTLRHGLLADKGRRQSFIDTLTSSLGLP